MVVDQGEMSMIELRSNIEGIVGNRVDAVSSAIRRAGSVRPSTRITRTELGKCVLGAGVQGMHSWLLDAVWEKLASAGGGGGVVEPEGALCSDVLVYFTPPKVAKFLHKLNKQRHNMSRAYTKALECKRWDQAAFLDQHAKKIDGEIRDLPLDSDPLDTVHKAKMRALQQVVRQARTSLEKKTAVNALNLYKELMEIGHTPTPTPRGGRYMIKDYERPGTADELGGNAFNMLIDLLPPDEHQIWRGTLRKGGRLLWQERHDAKKRQFEDAQHRCAEQRTRANHMAFSKSPYRPADTAAKPGTTSRPHTSASEQRPGTGAQRPPSRGWADAQMPPEARHLLNLAADALSESGRTAGQVLPRPEGGGGALRRADLEGFLEAAGVPARERGEALVEALWRHLELVCGGGVTAEALEVLVESAGEQGPGGYVTWVHPRRGMLLLSARQGELLDLVGRRLAQRWRYIRDPFMVLGRRAHVTRSELRGLLGGLTVHAKPTEFEALWRVFAPEGGDAVPWEDLRRAFGVDAAEERFEEREAAAARRAQEPPIRRYAFGLKKRKDGAGAVADPWDSMTEEEKIKELMTTTYARDVGRRHTPDMYAMHSPLYWKMGGIGTSPKKSMRPISQAGSRPASVDLSSTRVSWADSPVKARSKTPDLSAGSPGGAGPCLQPFSSVGSTLRMSWRRWNGGDTLGAQKSCAQDPAAPGLSASMMPGAGEFKENFEKKREMIEAFRTLIKENPDIHWNYMKSAYKIPPGFLEREAARNSSPEHRGGDEGADDIKSLFPSGMQAGAGPQSRPSSRAALSGAATRRNPVATPKQKSIVNPAGCLKKELEDSSEAALVGAGTMWRDVGPPWKSTSSTIGELLPVPPPHQGSDIDGIAWAKFGLGRAGFD